LPHSDVWRRARFEILSWVGVLALVPQGASQDRSSGNRSSAPRNPFTPFHNRWYIHVEAVAFGRAYRGREVGGKARHEREMDELMNPLLG
jgi:hypothetical protein